MTALAPSFQRTALIVVTGVVVTAILALVIGRVVPQPLLIASAFAVFLAADVAVDKLTGALAAVALGIAVVGNAWAFGAWCSIRELSMTPAMLGAAVVVALVVALGRILPPRTVLALGARLTPFSTITTIIMMLGWRFARRGFIGCAVALLFVGWSALWLLVAVSQVNDDDDKDTIIGGAAQILGHLAGVAWNLLVFQVRFTDDDDDLGFAT